MKYNIEIISSIYLEGIEADNEDDAIEKAYEIAENESWHYNENVYEVEDD